jgi:hypothetical protein
LSLKQDRRLDDDQLATAQRRRDVGQRRDLQDPAQRGDVLRDGPRPLAPGVEDLFGALPRPCHRARGQRLDGVEHELHRRHDAEAAAASAQSAEELGIVIGVRAHVIAVGGHEFDRGDAVAREPVLAREPAEAAAERVADDADVVRGARHRSEAEGGRGAGHVRPQRPGADSRDPGRRIDPHPAHALGGEQDRALERAHRRRPVARALGRHAQTLLAGEVHDGGDVGVRQRERHRGRPLIDGEVPRAPRLVPAVVVRPVDLAAEAGSERVDVSGGEVGDQHGPDGRGQADPAHRGCPKGPRRCPAASRRRWPCR